jgi:hypothetical protein
MSIVYDKLTLFNDAGICALTSASDFTAKSLSDHPTALFLKIPDEKDTRHNLAAIFILNIYKTLIKVASATPELALPRNVYFIMDEFGNMPKISKFDKFITVGRSRKIWFTMIVQSYAQLNNVYGDNVADIIKGNCGIKMFIGSNDMETCEKFSKLCGNMTVQQTNVSGSTSDKGEGVSYSNSLVSRPLIYPNDLMKLNNKYSTGNSIIITFGNNPNETGFAIGENIRWQSLNTKCRLDFGLTYFNTDTYNARISHYEPSLLYAFGSTLYYYRGIRSSLLASIPLFKQSLFINTKIGITKYFNRNNIRYPKGDAKGI